MDVVLEVFDTFLGDRLYASLLPAFKPIQTNAFAPNATFSNLIQAAPAYSYHPASQYFSFEPTDLTYMSQWSRDNIFRQGVSLFLITW